MRTLITMMVAAVAAMLVTEPAAAKAPSKAQVSAVGCMSLTAARAAYGNVYLRYRLFEGTRCWYAPGKPLARKPAPPVRVAKVAPAAAPPPVVPDLARVEHVLCGGLCPRFDLHNGPDAALYRALCGGPCPNYADPRFDDAFRAFGLSGR